MVDGLSDSFSFWIVTQDRDWLDSGPYCGISVNTWSQVGRAMVYYTPPGSLSYGKLKRIVADVGPDVIYLNGLFPTSSIRFLGWRRLGLLPDTPVVLAPRGELSPGALKLKWLKKRLFISLSSRLGLLDRLLWHATSPLEEKHIYVSIGTSARSVIAPNIPGACDDRGRQISRSAKRPGAMRIVYLSRITPKKNLSYALKTLSRVRGYVKFDIYGAADPESYWHSCQPMLASLPENVQVEYRGNLPNERVAETLFGYDFFFLPTLGENFGHAIFESFSAGCPVLISDQTPWRNLTERRLGWDIALDEPDRWRSVLQECIDMEALPHNVMSKACTYFAGDWLRSSGVLDKTIQLFREAV
jgi:glycosyltransferase involved in cell wall biosynthesis